MNEIDLLLMLYHHASANVVKKWFYLVIDANIAWETINIVHPVTEECDVNICENGAICKQLAGDYICECSPDFTGAICENKGILMFICDHNR